MVTIGIIGGGQLGMMLAEEIHNLGAKAICLDPNPKCPASYVCDETIVSEYSDLEGLKKLGDKCDVLTYEFENVPADKLKFLKDKYNFLQGIEPLFDSQNRIREKTNAKNLGLNTPKFKAIYSKDDLLEGIKEIGMPCVYKTTTLGYDGHGQVVIKCEDDLKKVEPYLNGEGILDLVIAEENKAIFEEIKNASYAFMEKADYLGILTIEYFVKGDKFYFNEMAPRPHNSGHYTIEGCTTNQYRELARFLLGMPLDVPKLKSPTIMKNILGFDYDNMKKILANDNVFIHDYHKADVRKNRKMAHITFTNMTITEYNKEYKNRFEE